MYVKLDPDLAPALLHQRGVVDHQHTQALFHPRGGDALVVWKLDRLGRTVRQLVGLVGDLGARGVAFRSLTHSIDTSTPVDVRLMSPDP